MPPRRWPTRDAAKAISRTDMPLAFMTSAVTRNIRITISSLPLLRPIADWEVEKGTSGSGRGQNSSPRKLGRNAMIPTTDSMKTIGIPASVRATKITARATRGGPRPPAARRRPPDDGGDPRRAEQGQHGRPEALARLGHQPGGPRSTAER